MDDEQSYINRYVSSSMTFIIVFKVLILVKKEFLIKIKTFLFT